MKLGKNIAIFRKGQNLSQEELGELMDVSRQTISNWELGETTPTSEQVIMLSKIFKITTDELLGLDSKDIIVERMSGTEKLVKKNIKFTKILFITIYALILSLLLGIGIYCFTLRDFTNDYQEGVLCKINDMEYHISISPGIVKEYSSETKKFVPYESVDHLWKMYVESTNKETNEISYQLEFSAGYSYKDAFDSLNLVKKNIIKRGGTCR